MSTAATTANAPSAREEAESLKEQDAASRLEAVAADVLGLADIGADEEADVPGDSPELWTRTRARAGGARGGARQCSGGWRRFMCARGWGGGGKMPCLYRPGDL
jgi:hypothetical protein